MLGSHATVLVVDDDDAVREEMAAGLAEQFDQVLEAPSAELAIHACETGEIHVVAASDRLPGSGADALRLALAADEAPSVVAYALTGSVRPVDTVVVAARCRALLRRPGSGRRRAEPAAARRARRVRPGALRWR